MGKAHFDVQKNFQRLDGVERRKKFSPTGKMKKSLCDYRHHPVCRGYKSGTDAYMAIVASFDMLMVRGNPARGRKEGTHLLLF